MIKCGHCRSSHGTVAKVRECATNVATTDTAGQARERRERLEELARSDARAEFNAEDERAMHRMEAEGDRAESRRDSAAKAAKWDAEMRAWTLTDDPAELRTLVARVDRLLVTQQIPEEYHRWSRAIRALISGQGNVRITEYAMRSAKERLEAFPVMLEIDPAYPSGRVEKPWSNSPKVTAEGLYRLDGNLYQVTRSKDSDRLYAKLVTFPEGKKRPILTYAKGAIFRLRPEHLVPMAEANELTQKTGWCVFGHFLTNPVSIARGMGPVCWERYGGSHESVA